VVIFKRTGPDIETPNAYRGRGMGRGNPPPQSTKSLGVRADPRPKTKTILVHFVPEKPLLVNRILLSVAKCRVIELFE